MRLRSLLLWLITCHLSLVTGCGPLRAQPVTSPTDAAVMKTSTGNLTANLSTGNRTLTIASGGTLNAVSGSNIILAGTTTLSGSITSNATLTGGTLANVTATGTTTLNGAISGTAVVPVAQGGTARSTLTTDSILTGNTTGAVKSSEVYAFSTYTVVALGDSITQLGTYPARLQTLLGSGWQVVNEGITGQTTTAIAARVATSATQRSTAAYVIVAAGINDVAQGASAATIQNNLQAIYTALSGAGKTVVSLNIPPFGNNADWSAGKQTVLETVNTWIASTATGITHKVNIYNLLTGGSGDDLIPAYDSGDGLHPNTAGGNAIGDLIHSTVSTWTSALGLDARLRLGTPEIDIITRAGTGYVSTGSRWLFGNVTESEAIGSAAVDIRGGLSVAKAARITGNTTIGGIVRLGNGTSSGNVTSGDLVTPGGVGFGGNIYGGGFLSVVGSITSSGNNTITGGAFVSNGTGGMFTNTAAGTDARYIRVANTGGGYYLGVESSSAGSFFTGSNAYETVIYSPSNVVYARTPTFRFSGNTTVLGTGAFTDTTAATTSAGAVKVGAQTGTDYVNIGGGAIVAGGNITAGTRITASAATPEIRATASTTTVPFGLTFYGGSDYEASLKHQTNTGVTTLDTGRSSSWGAKFDLYVDTVRSARFTKTLSTFDQAASFSSTVTAASGYYLPPQTAPSNPASGWVLYTDSGDGNKLKAKASTGTVVTLGTP